MVQFGRHRNEVDGFILGSDEVALAAPAFGDLYWWGTPNEQPISRHEINPISASVIGKSTLGMFARYNDGVQILGDPISVEHDDIRAGNYEPGTVVKVTGESLNRPQSHIGPEYLYTRKPEAAGYSVMRHSKRGLPATYVIESSWSVVAEVKKGRLAFFPISIDNTASYGIGVHDGLGAVIKVGQVVQNGLENLAVGRTLTYHFPSSTIYQRYRNAKIYKPKQLPPPSHADRFKGGYSH